MIKQAVAAFVGAALAVVLVLGTQTWAETETETDAGTVVSTADVRIGAVRHGDDVHLSLHHADGGVISPGSDNIFRARQRSAKSQPISVEVERAPVANVMISERTARGVGLDDSAEISFSAGLWLCSTRFNTVPGRNAWGKADFELQIGSELYTSPTVGHSYWGSGRVYFVHVADDPYDNDALLPGEVYQVTPVEAHPDHRWSLYCNRVEHKR